MTLPGKLDYIGISTSKFFGWLGLTLILMPKINLISVAGQTAGLRIDDLLLTFSLIFIIFSSIGGYLRVNGGGYYQVIASFFISFLISQLLGWNSNILYVIRLLEYSAFIYLGFFFARSHRLSTSADIILTSNAIVMLLQAFGFWGGFTSDGYINEIGRLVGLTAGPWEIGYILNIIFIIFLIDKRLSFRALILRSGLILLMIFSTGSRASAITFLLISFFELNRRSTLTRAGFYFIILTAALIVFVLFFGEQLLQRSENILNAENIEYFFSFYQGLTPSGNFSMESFEETESLPDLDASWVIRSTHWALALNEFFAHPTFLPFGLGPGTFGPALDGAWTRILVEGGLIGLFLYISFLRKFKLIVQGGGMMIIATVINMVFIDIHNSYKSMALLLFVFGCNLRESKYGN